MNKFGLSERVFNLILESFNKFPQIEKVVIFGSRAMGNFKPGSDIDLAIFGDKIEFETTSRLHALLNDDLPIPYFVDVVNFNTIKEEALKEHILNEGIVIFENRNNKK